MIEYYNRWAIYPILKQKGEEALEKYRIEKGRDPLVTQDLYPGHEDISEQLICMEMAEGNGHRYRDYYETWDFADVYEAYSLKLITEFRDA